MHPDHIFTYTPVSRFTQLYQFISLTNYALFTKNNGFATEQFRVQLCGECTGCQSPECKGISVQGLLEKQRALLYQLASLSLSVAA